MKITRFKCVGWEAPQNMLADALSLAPDKVARLAIHLGCDSDPRFMAAVPAKFPFFRTWCSRCELA